MELPDQLAGRPISASVMTRHRRLTNRLAGTQLPEQENAPEEVEAQDSSEYLATVAATLDETARTTQSTNVEDPNDSSVFVTVEAATQITATGTITIPKGPGVANPITLALTLTINLTPT